MRTRWVCLYWTLWRSSTACSLESRDRLAPPPPRGMRHVNLDGRVALHGRSESLGLRGIERRGNRGWLSPALDQTPNGCLNGGADPVPGVHKGGFFQC